MQYEKDTLISHTVKTKHHLKQQPGEKNNGFTKTIISELMA